MALFIRTRRLDLTRLERKPQENIDVVHVILKAAIRDIGDKLRRLERQFYGARTSAEDEVRKWTKPVDNVLKSVHMGQITNSWQIDEIIRQSGEQTDHFSIDLSDLGKLQECYRKILDAVPAKFVEIVADCRTVVKYLEKYCLTFYDPHTDVPYETAEHYESKRRRYLQTIRTNLAAINANAEKFRTKQKGFDCSTLSDYGFHLARKTDSTHLCFLLLFPQSAHNVRLSLEAMTSLIDTDSDYPTFVRNDVIDFERQRDESLKGVRHLQQKFHQLSFRLKHLESEINKMETELGKLNDKEVDLMINEEELIAETNEIQVEIEMKEYRRDELIRKAAELHPQVLYEKYGQLSESLRELKRRLPFAKRELLAARHKLQWLSGKKVELRQTKAKLDKLRREMNKIEQEKLEHEVEHDDIVKCLELAKKIFLRKVSADSVEKIFHNRPVEVNRYRLPGQRTNDDPFERVCQVVSEHIDGDWPKLYRALPFYPPRGISTIDGDIEELTNVESRVGGQYLALKALYRWRRFHTRAKVEDINSALVAIKRHDVINKIDLDLNPPEPLSEEEEEEITYVEEYLIPFVRQVERFDELRAQNRL